MREGVTTYTVNRDGYHLVVDDVSAWICQQCHEVHFEEAPVGAIQHPIRRMDEGVCTSKITA